MGNPWKEIDLAGVFRGINPDGLERERSGDSQRGNHPYLIADLNTSVRNKFRRDPEVLAEWSTASRIHRTGRRRNDNDTPPPEPPVV